MAKMLTFLLSAVILDLKSQSALASDWNRYLEIELESEVDLKRNYSFEKL